MIRIMGATVLASALVLVPSQTARAANELRPQVAQQDLPGQNVDAGGQAPTVWRKTASLAASVDDLGLPDTQSHYFPQAVTLGGTTYVSWRDLRADDPYGQRNAEIELRSSPDGGRTWSPLRNLSRTPMENEFGQAMASDGDSVLVVAPAQTPNGVSYTSDVLNFTRLDPRTQDVNRTQIQSAIYAARVAGNEGNYYLLGESMSNPAEFMRSTDGGATWSDPQVLGTRPDDGCIDTGGHVAADATVVATVWRAGADCGGSRFDIRIRVSRDGGVTFDPAIALTQTPQSELHPSVAVLGDTVVVAWITPRSDASATIDLVRSTDAGASWSPPIRVGDIGTRPLGQGGQVPELSIAGDDIFLYAAFTHMSYRSTDGGATWTAMPDLPQTGNHFSVATLTSAGLLAVGDTTLDAYLGSPIETPSAPTGVTATRGDGSATVTWAPSIENGSPVDEFVVTSTPAGITHSVDGDQTAAVIAGLTNGTRYTFTVVAKNDAGTSPASNPSNEVTPAGIPDAVTTPTAVRGDSSATVSWTPAGGNGSPVTAYTVTSTPGSKTCTTTNALTCTVTGLNNGTPYTFTLVATNAIGDSPPSAASNAVTPAGVPFKLRAPKVVVRGSKALIKWAAGSPNGSAITRYRVDISKGKDRTVAASARQATFKGLRPGRYRVRVAARNAIGTGSYSAWVAFRIR